MIKLESYGLTVAQRTTVECEKNATNLEQGVLIWF